MAAITLEKLAKVYPGGVRALDGLDLDVAEGEFVVLVGPSGCGKTTALRLVAGLETITEGTVKFGGRSVNGVSPRHRDVAMVFQNYALYPHLTVAENLGFSLVNKGMPRTQREARIRSVAEVLGLSPFLRRTPAHLSGGQRQRVAMGRAIIREPAVFCMDEPLSNLDAKLRAAMRAEIVRVHQSIGAATLYVTHDQVEAMTMGDRVVVLDQGVLQQCGTPRSLYEHPANLFVAAFIGSPEMNLFQGAVADGGELVLGSQRLALPEPPAALAPYRGREVIAGLRPEALTLADGDTGGAARPGGPGQGGTAAPGALSADVRAVESIGSEAYAFFAIDAPAAAAAGTTTADVPSELAHNGVARLSPRKLPRPGARVTFTVDSGRLLFFDPGTGQSIA
ncbi:MAG TPA: ATP-binding cassette domain-containing protein [Trebonia sp.]|jgi:multiple sugar transport system ATP-binding protein